MRFRRGLLLLAVLRAVAAPAALTASVDPDHADGLYKAGETTTFTILVTDTDSKQPATTGTVNWALTKDGVGDLGKATVTLTGQPFKVEGKLGEPGILRLTVTAPGQPTPVGFGGAAYDPYQLQPAAPPPADFDAWWDAQKKLLAATPIDAQIVANEAASTADVAVSEVSLAVLDGGRIHGWFCRPKAPGKYPARLDVPGAGVSPIGPAVSSGARYLSLNISVHDQPMAREKAYYDELWPNGALKGYFLQGRESRDTFYYRRVFLGFVRAIDFLTGQADWDGKNMMVNGSSQGGGSTIVAAGLDPRVTVATANVPALCDHKGLLVDRASGWPRLIPAKDAKAVIETAGYYDAANFARRITCPILVSVGLIDTTCPATSVFAAFDAIGAKEKKLLIYPKMGHAVSKDWWTQVGQWQDSHLLPVAK